MARQLLDALNAFRIGLQSSHINDKMMDEKTFLKDDYLNDLYRRVCIEAWSGLFATRYAIDVKTLDILLICGYRVLCDEQLNVYLCFSEYQIKILNPMNVGSHVTA